MAAPDLPTEYDEIVLGTGLQESILAAALARIGHRVLHLDRNDYYSGDWATFHLRSLQEWIDKHKNPEESDVVRSSSLDEQEPEDQVAPDTSQLGEGEHFLELPQNPNTVRGIEVTCYVRQGVELPSLERVIVPPRLSTSDEEPQRLGAEGQDPSQNAPEADASTDDTHAAADQSQAEGEDPENEALQNSANEDRESSSAASPSISVDQSETVDGAAGGLTSSEQVEGQSSQGEGQSSCEPASDEHSEQEPESVGEQEQESPAQEVEGQGASNQGSVDEGQSSSRTERGRRDWTWAEINQLWRKFNIDLAPKLMFCRGSMVELLVSSRISRYAEFKAVTRILSVIKDKLELVPCSRSDVFSSKYVSVLEKRMLMRLIEFCLHYQDRLEDFEEFRDRPFEEFLKARKLTPTLQHFVMHSIAMVTASTPTEEALKSMQFFLRSLGRYGNTAFLWTLYGSGELPQCFCRMCAVFAGIYMLRTNLKKLIVDENNVCKGGIDSDGRRLTCNNLIMETSYAPQQAANTTLGTVSRGILLTDRSLKPTDNEEITLLTVPPPPGQNNPIRVLELGAGSCACPRDMFVVHLTCAGTGQARADLQNALDDLFQPLDTEEADQVSTKPKVLWSLFFSQVDSSVCEDTALAAGLPSNVLVTAGPGTSVGFEHAVTQAKRLFERLCPGEDFLPAAPEPEDIIFEDQSKDNPGEHKEVGFEASSTSEEPEKQEGEGMDQAASKTSLETDGASKEAGVADAEGNASKTDQEQSEDNASSGM
ncbi:rab proteins geranylgeranyltransferase component A 2-like [Patiria miniata]|uniref:Rab proteins geranylgeranyltransferase component A n=1 Tax=Patiria miniata TaxID=46514 RepID=A0A913ZWG5_PATMI|nr:rab proteins geranylgeranyltransferase component A 2-like [Patiria miniata]